MKNKINLMRIMRAAMLFGIIFFACLVSARAQQLIPFVDCVEPVDGSNYRAYFGYISTYSSNVPIEPDTPGNFFSPIVDIPGQPGIFLPGVHHRAVSVIVPNGINETWFLDVESATSRRQAVFPCNDAGSNTRTITYQGNLKDGSAAANGQYDLRFQIFNAASGGASKSATLALEDVPVTNGIFTAQLDFGILPAMLDGGNLYLEIGVRAGTSTGAYTTLTPRQPLTATPYAIRAQSAANADLLGGVSSEGFIRMAGDGYTSQTITSNLTVTGTITGTITNAQNATNVSGGFVQLPLTSGAPPASECSASNQYGRQKVDSTNAKLYICIASGWKSTTLQ